MEQQSSQVTSITSEAALLRSQLQQSESKLSQAVVTIEQLQAQLRALPSPAIAQSSVIDVEAAVAKAVAETQARAEADKAAAIQEAVESLKRMAQEQLSKKREARGRQERISIIGTAAVPPAVIAAAPAAPSARGTFPNGTPFKHTESVVEEDEDEDDEDIPQHAFHRGKGTPAKPVAEPAHTDDSEEEWEDGSTAVATRLTFIDTAATVKPAGILKAAPVSRVESIRNIARSLSTIGPLASKRAQPSVQLEEHGGKLKKRVTFVSPSHDQSETTVEASVMPVEQPAFEQENSQASVAKKTVTATPAATPRIPSKKTKLLGCVFIAIAHANCLHTCLMLMCNAQRWR